MTDKRIRVRVDSGNSKSEIRDLNNEMRGLGRTADSTNNTFGKLKATFVAVSSALAVGAIARYADSWTRLNNQIKQTTQSTSQALAVQEAIFRIAKDSRVEVEGVAEAYQRISNSVSEFGFSAGESLTVVEGLTKAFKSNGASAQEVSSVLLQLGQGLGTGALQGDELRAVLEASLPVSKAIAKEFGVTVGQLKELGSQGELTTERVFNAIKNSLPEFESAFSRANVTIAESIKVADNSLTRLIGEIDGATDASAVFANGLIELSNAIDFLGDAVASGAASEIAGVFQDQLSLIGRDVDITAAFIANIWNDLGGQIAADTVASTVDIGDAFLNIIPNIRTLVQVITVEIASAADKLGAYATAVAETLNPFDDVSVDQARGFFDQQLSSIDEVREASLQSIFDQRQKEKTAQQERINEAQRLIEKYKEQREARELSLSSISSGRSGDGSRQGGDGAGGSTGANQTVDISAQIAREQLATQKLQEEIELRKAFRQGEINQRQLEEEQGLIDVFFQYEQRRLAILENERLTAEQKQELISELNEQEIAAEQLKQEQLTAVTRQGEEDRSEIERLAQNARINNLQSGASSALGLLAAFGDKSFKTQKKFAIAESIVSIVGGVAKALNNPYPANLGFAAQVAAEGAVLISKLKSTNPSSGGSSVAVGGGSAPATPTPVAQESTNNQQRIIDIRGIPEGGSVTLNREELTALLSNDDDVILSVNQGQSNGRRVGLING